MQLQALFLQYALHPSDTKSKVAGTAHGSLGRTANNPWGFKNKIKLSPDPMSMFNIRKPDFSRIRMGHLLKLNLKLKCVL